MTETRIRAIFKRLDRESRNKENGIESRHNRPTTLMFKYDKQGNLKSGEIRGRQGLIYSWPKGFESRLEEKEARTINVLNLTRKGCYYMQNF